MNGNKRAQGSFEYVLMIAGVVLVLTVIVVLLQSQAVTSSGQVEQNVEYHAQVACDASKMQEQASFLVGSWHFNEGTGTTARDSSGNNNDGTLTNGPKWTVGKFRKGLQFDGKDDYLGIPLTSPLSSQEMTGCAWVKVNQAGTSGKDGILVAEAYRFHMWVYFDGSFSYGAWGDDGTPPGYNVEFKSTNSFPFEVWTHVCVVNIGSDTTTLYVNGNFEDVSQMINATGALVALYPINAFEVGRHTSNDMDYFDGVIDEVRFYSKALTAQEVLADMNCGHLA